ncbi:hypothetical protein [Hyphomonas sp.]|nr:hypothetical protein [Hyphomonas sp.]
MREVKIWYVSSLFEPLSNPKETPFIGVPAEDLPGIAQQVTRFE